MKYDDLISSLRICRRMNSANDNCIAFHDGSCEAEPVCMYELMDKAANAIEELQSLLYLMKSNADWLSEKIPKWIPVTERLPELHEEVLVCTEDYGETELGFATVAVYDGSGWLECWERKQYLNYVTHWMPLPPAPKEE